MTPVTALLVADHREIDALLAESLRDGVSRVDLEAYDRFRARLLRHIGWEEKILFPAVVVARGGEPLSRAKALRKDHGRIAALLTRRPTPEIVSELVSLVAAHDAIEEGPSGVYAECEPLVAADAASLLERMRAAPEVPLAPFYEGPVPLPKR